MEKVKTSVTLSNEILDWIDKEIENRKFASRSHAVEYCINKIMKLNKTI
ncbi:MAG: hypothetical protein ISS36_01670 [Candidatus Aenigmarchaeota archaeon]|nr:hypothetical protein [Candidatus Aenigmarchaeota archaeon]